MMPTSGTSSATDNGSGDSNNGCEPAHPGKPQGWTVRCVLIKALLLLFLPRIEVLLNGLTLIYALFSICYQKPIPKCSENLVEDEVKLQKLELDSLLPEVKGRILEHLDHEDIFKLKSLSKGWKALIESVEFIQALSLRVKPVLTACSFFIDKGVWQWVAFDPNWNSTSGQKGKWRKLPPLTFLPPNCDPDPDLFKQFLLCAKDGLVLCMNFFKSPHEELLIVFNPLTEQWKELPPLLHRRNPVLMHMYVDQSSKSYHVLVAGSSASGEESLSRITELYDSRTGQWERVGDFPGPAFALNEYQSGVFQNGNIFCIGFLELGDQTVKGILGYNVEGLWLTKWTAEALPNSTILLLSLRRLCATQNPDGDKTSIWKLQAFRDSYLGSMIELNGMKVPLLSFKPLRIIKMQTKGSPSSVWCSILRVVGFLSCLRVVEARPAPAPSPSTYPMSSTYPPFFYAGVAATIIGTAIGVISLGVSIYYHRRERGDSVCGVLDVLTRPFRERPSGGMCMHVNYLKVGEASVNGYRLESPV